MLEVALIDHDYMIEQIVSKTSNPSFGDCIGEGRQLHRMTTMPIPLFKSPTHTIR